MKAHWLKHLASGVVAMAAALAASAQEPPQQPVVATAAVQRVTMTPMLTVNGNVFSRNDVEMTAAVTGELDWVAEPGTRLAKGDIVARLDERAMSLRLEEQQFLRDREAVNEVYFSKEAERLATLRENQNVSALQLDEALARRDTSRKELAVLSARIRQIENEIERSRLRARFAGVVAERFKEAGEYVAAGEVVARFVDVDRLEVRTDVPISFREQLGAGSTLELMLAENEVFASRVRTLIPAGDPVSQTLGVRVDVPESVRQRVVPGQLLKVRIPLQSAGTRLAVPRDAVVVRREGSFVFRLKGDSVAERIEVHLGEGQGDLVSVTGKLEDGDRIVVRGAERLQEGQKVTVLG